MNHLITIITPTYNCEKYIGECLESVRSQNLEHLVKHIVIDGVSEDMTCNIIESFDNVDFISEPDQGQSDAFNKGIIRAESPWIMLLDGDDILLPGSLLRYIKLINEKSPDIVYGHQSFIDKEANILKVNTSIKFKKRYALNGLYIPPSSGLCFKSSVIKNQLFDVNHHYNMDTEWFLNLKKRISSGVISLPTTGFRIWEGSKTFSLTKKYSDDIEDESAIEEIKKERHMLDKKYYTPYRDSISKKHLLFRSLIPVIIKVDYLYNKVIMKLKYLILSSISN